MKPPKINLKGFYFPVVHWFYSPYWRMAWSTWGVYNCRMWNDLFFLSITLFIACCIGTFRTLSKSGSDHPDFVKGDGGHTQTYRPSFGWKIRVAQPSGHKDLPLSCDMHLMYLKKFENVPTKICNHFQQSVELKSICCFTVWLKSNLLKTMFHFFFHWIKDYDRPVWWT